MSLKNLFLLLVVFACLLTPLGRLWAQTFTTLHTFTPVLNHTNSDGANPNGVLVLSGKTLYGTTGTGGSSAKGNVLAINTDGTCFTNLHDFSALVFNTNSDGADPYAGLTLSTNTLYGTTQYGGALGYGTVFAVNTNGTGFTNLHSFSYSDGINPQCQLVYCSNMLYGTALSGGLGGNGSVFKLNVDGTSFTNLYSFSTGTGTIRVTNTDGAWPESGLILSNNTLYGTTWSGGGAGNGTVFRVNTDGTCFTNLHSFSASPGDPYTNSDGADPYGPLVLSGNTLYGTAEDDGTGAQGNGTVFRITTGGLNFTNLHNFTYTDGAFPYGSLILSGNTLYGTTSGGGLGRGTVFALNTDGTAFTNVYNFLPASGGSTPYAGLLLSGYTLYGTTYIGHTSNNGTLFSLSYAPQLQMISSSTNAILKWPTNNTGFDYTGFALQFTTNLGPSAIWNTNPSTPVLVNGLNIVTNPITPPQRFFRLSQ